MGGSKSSCFNILACRCGDQVDGDDLRAEEEEEEERKASSDKQRWSFRKRSSSHRVLINADTSEPVPVSETKENLEALTNNVDITKDFAVAEKEHIQERPRVTFSLPSATEDTKEGNSSVTIENTLNLPEYDSVAIQSYIRGFLARKEFQEQKSIVKLQAAVRGHLVRRQAVGTLRCVQAIVKMQALVRARHARCRIENISRKNTENQIGNERSNPLEKGVSEKTNKTYSSIEKLLSNRFARQLLESSSKSKAINIKCDPLKSDSTWKWLGRWMSVMPLDVRQQQKQLLDQLNQETIEGTKLSENEEAYELTCATISVLSDTKLAATETDLENLTPKDASDFEFNVPLVSDYNFSSLSKENIQSSQLQNEVLGAAEYKITKTEKINESSLDSLSGSLQSHLDPTSEKVDQEHSATESDPSGIHDSDGKKYLQASRRSRSPAFAAVQSKFEEISSKSSISKSNISPYQDAAAALKPRQDNHKIQQDPLTKIKETPTENFHDAKAQVAASECGTEISISSTLDSPDRSETEGEEIVELEREKTDISADNDNMSISDMVIEEKKPSFLTNAPKSEMKEDGNNKMVHSIALVDSVQANGHAVEATHVKVINDVKVNSLSEESPRSHATVPSAHGTPSSQISTNTKKIKKDANLATQKQKSLSAVKISPTNSGNNSGGRSSTEHVSKENTGKRRDSFGTTNIDQEPRISSSNPLPSYMQATVSARAKSHTNVSPKMSPDVHDNPTKKRHSLPIENNKNSSSPNMHRSISQTQHDSRTGTTNSPQNSAERRWQR